VTRIVFGLRIILMFFLGIWTSLDAVGQESVRSSRVEVRLTEIPKPISPPRLIIADLAFSDAQRGNNNLMLDADELVYITFRLRNEGQGEAYKTRLKVKQITSMEGVVFSPVKEIGDLKPGETREVNLELSTKREIKTSEIDLEMAISEGNSFDPDPATIRFPTQAFKTPQLVLADAVYSSKTGGKIAKMEPVSLDVIVQNRGQGTARQVKVHFRRPDNVFPAGDDDFDLGTLEPNQNHTIRYEFFTNAKYVSPNLSIEVRGEESYGQYGFKSEPSVSLDAVLSSKPTLTIEGKSKDQIEISEVSLVSDVDRNIPHNNLVNPHRYALIIGNEDYARYQTGLNSESNVAFARNDAQVFYSYCQKTLGIDPSKIVLLLDATTGRMKQELERLYRLIDAEKGQAEVYFYYAGHGQPHEATKEPYLIPGYVNGSDPTQGIALKDLYVNLGKYPSRRVLVFLDACFSGGARGNQLLAMRGVKIKVDDAPIKGNLMVFTASSGEESALPWTDKQHGFFTYHLLKKLQESQGNVTVKDLSDYLKSSVRLKALQIVGKDQNPQLLTAPDISQDWPDWSIR